MCNFGMAAEVTFNHLLLTRLTDQVSLLASVCIDGILSMW